MKQLERSDSFPFVLTMKRNLISVLTEETAFLYNKYTIIVYRDEKSRVVTAAAYATSSSLI